MTYLKLYFMGFLIALVAYGVSEATGVDIHIVLNWFLGIAFAWYYTSYCDEVDKRAP